MTVKRSREDGEEESMAMADCLMQLSEKRNSSGRVFQCKTCNRQFSSFQALGGHRASHRRPRLATAGDLLSSAKPKTHECSVCGLEFAMGQALGGHMRRHGRQKSTEKKCGGSGKRLVLCLDLNLTPYENHLVQFGLGNFTATV